MATPLENLIGLVEMVREGAQVVVLRSPVNNRTIVVHKTEVSNLVESIKEEIKAEDHDSDCHAVIEGKSFLEQLKEPTYHFCITTLSSTLALLTEDEVRAMESFLEALDSPPEPLVEELEKVSLEE